MKATYIKITEVSFKKIAHFSKVPARTGLTVLDC